MTDPKFNCPSCGTEIRLTESLAAPLLEATRQQFQQQMAEKDRRIADREKTLNKQQEELAKAQECVDELVAEKLKAERATIASEEAKKARLLLGADLDQKAAELAELQEIVKQRDEKLAEAQKSHADMLKMQRELAEAKRELDLTIERRVQESLTEVRDKAKQEIEHELKLKVLEKEHTISSMQKQIEDLKRRAEQGSMQLQGEVQELHIEALLREAFPQDSIEPVPKGVFGGDAIHRVFGDGAKCCGTILWESKRTKSWTDGWLSKLRDDQRAAKAEFAVIVSRVLPKGLDTFDHIDGVWVTSPNLVVPVAIALRHSLRELAHARQASEGQQTKMEMVYQYLTGPRFRHRVQAIVEKFADMQQDLDKERRTMTKLWAKREQQIRSVIESTAGMYGDLQGIAGRTLLEVEGLDILSLDSTNRGLPEFQTDQ